MILMTMRQNMKDILIFADQTAVQNKDNTSRIYYELGTKNKRPGVGEVVGFGGGQGEDVRRP